MEVEKRIVVNGGMKLPIGYRFHPTEQELILHYLLPKAFASPLPSSIIPVFDLFFSHPLSFPGLFLSLSLSLCSFCQSLYVCICLLVFLNCFLFKMVYLMFGSRSGVSDAKTEEVLLSGDQKEKQRYFFCKKREVSSNEHRIKISSGDGYWKPIGKERPIIACGKTFGIRRTLAFYETNKSSSYCNKTRWSMTEYCLAGFASAKVHNNYSRLL